MHGALAEADHQGEGVLGYGNGVGTAVVGDRDAHFAEASDIEAVVACAEGLHQLDLGAALHQFRGYVGGEGDDGVDILKKWSFLLVAEGVVDEEDIPSLGGDANHELRPANVGTDDGYFRHWHSPPSQPSP